jgi:DNA polymerase-4
VADWVFHVDLDQFLAAVEVQRRPELAGRPVVVGGDGDPARPRQVVATASYEARAFGVRSGMPLRQAARRCPDAVFLPSDRPVYEAASARVMAALRAFPLVVEEWGWDEAFVAAPRSGQATAPPTAEPEELARAVRRHVQAETGLSCAVGIGETKLQAKTATGFAKPGGVARLTRRSWLPTMGSRPVTALWGIGSRTADRLAEAGIHTVAELAEAGYDDLVRRFGPTIGPFLGVLGRGGDDSPVSDEPRLARSRSREETFEHDLARRDDIERELDRLAREAVESILAEGRPVTHVAVKGRTAAFFTRTKIRKLPEPTTGATTIARAALELLGRFDLDRPVRLLGVRLVLEVPEDRPTRPERTSGAAP